MGTKEQGDIERVRQSHEDRQLVNVNRIADIVAERGNRSLTTHNLQLLFGMTTQSLLDHGLIEPGEKHGVYDTGELRLISDLNRKVLEISDEMYEQMGIDEMGDWAAEFSARQELTDFLVGVAEEFETKLLANIGGK